MFDIVQFIKQALVVTMAFVSTINPLNTNTQLPPVPIDVIRSLTISADMPTPTSALQQNIETYTQPVNSNPLIDCVGPDGKHFQTTQKECDDFNNAWGKPQQKNNVPLQTSYSSEPLVACVFSYGTYQLTQSSCNSYKERDKSYAPQYTPPQYYSCTLCYSFLGTCSTYNYVYKTKEECDAEQQELNQSVQELNQSVRSSPTPTDEDLVAEEAARKRLEAAAARQYRDQVMKCQARLRGSGMQDSSLTQECY